MRKKEKELNYKIEVLEKKCSKLVIENSSLKHEKINLEKDLENLKNKINSSNEIKKVMEERIKCELKCTSIDITSNLNTLIENYINLLKGDDK